MRDPTMHHATNYSMTPRCVKLYFNACSFNSARPAFVLQIHQSSSASRAEKLMNVAERQLVGHLLKKAGTFGTKTGFVNVLGEWPQEAMKTKFLRLFLNSYCVVLCRGPVSLVRARHIY